MGTEASAVDVAVVGGGIVGLCCAWWLREAGASVLLADPAPGTGHSTGAGRMFRHAHRRVVHAELARRASGLWDDLSGRLGGLERPLLARIGALHTMGGRAQLEPLEAALAASEIGYEILGAADIRTRWPNLGIDPPIALFDPTGGRIEAAAAITGLRHDLRGALSPMRVEAIWPGSSGAELRSAGQPVKAGTVVVCAGLETRRLVAPLGIEIAADRALAATRLTFTKRGGEAPDLPCVHERSGQLGERIVYFFPGEWGGVSIGLESLPEMLSESLAERIRACLERALPNEGWRQSQEVAARLEVLDDSDHDLIEIHLRGPVWAIAGWNLFKHAPAIGEGIAELVAGRPAPLLDRLPGTRASDPPGSPSRP